MKSNNAIRGIAADAMEENMNLDELNKVAVEHSDRVDESLWVGSLLKLSDSDDRNPILSGYACALLLER